MNVESTQPETISPLKNELNIDNNNNSSSNNDSIGGTSSNNIDNSGNGIISSGNNIDINSSISGNSSISSSGNNIDNSGNGSSRSGNNIDNTSTSSSATVASSTSFNNTTINNNNNSNNNSNGNIKLKSSSSKINNNNSKESHRQDNLKLWISNLPPNSTEKDIREFFSKFKIDSIKISEISESQSVSAVVQFFDNESASLARENGLSTTFKGSKLFIDWSNSPTTVSPTNSSFSNLTSTLSYYNDIYNSSSSSNSNSNNSNSNNSDNSNNSYSSNSNSYNSSNYNYNYNNNNNNNNNISNKESQKHFHPYPSHQHHQHRYNNTHSTSNVNISPKNSSETKERITDNDPRVNRKLFLGLTYEGETIEDLRNRFGKYGKVEEVVISATGLARLRFYSTESAILAKRDLGFRYKIQFDKKEPRDLQYYDPNGPSSYYSSTADRYSNSLDQNDYGILDNSNNSSNRSSAPPPPSSSSSQLTPPAPLAPAPVPVSSSSSSSSSDYYKKDSYRDSYRDPYRDSHRDLHRDSYRDSHGNKNHYYNDKQSTQQQQQHQQQIPTPQLSNQISAAFSEPLSNEEYNQFYSFLENLKSTNQSIKESKDWFILHLKSGKLIVQLINRYITNTSGPVYNKIEVIYLINDILYFGLVRRTNPEKDPISDLFEAFLPSILSSFHKESQSVQNNCLKVLDFWEEKHYYSAKAVQAFRNYIFQ